MFRKHKVMTTIGIILLVIFVFNMGPFVLAISTLFDQVIGHKGKVEKEVLNYLEDRYHEEFVIESVGSSSEIRSITITASPLKSPSQKFYVYRRHASNRDIVFEDDLLLTRWDEEAAQIIDPILARFAPILGYRKISIAQSDLKEYANIDISKTLQEINQSNPKLVSVNLTLMYVVEKAEKNLYTDAIIQTVKSLNGLGLLNSDVNIQVYDQEFFGNKDKFQALINQGIPDAFPIEHSSALLANFKIELGRPDYQKLIKSNLP